MNTERFVFNILWIVNITCKLKILNVVMKYFIILITFINNFKLKLLKKAVIQKFYFSIIFFLQNKLEYLKNCISVNILSKFNHYLFRSSSEKILLSSRSQITSRFQGGQRICDSPYKKVFFGKFVTRGKGAQKSHFLA